MESISESPMTKPLASSAAYAAGTATFGSDA